MDGNSLATQLCNTRTNPYAGRRRDNTTTKLAAVVQATLKYVPLRKTGKTAEVWFERAKEPSFWTVLRPPEDIRPISRDASRFVPNPASRVLRITSKPHGPFIIEVGCSSSLFKLLVINRLGDYPVLFGILCGWICHSADGRRNSAHSTGLGHCRLRSR